MIETAPMLGLCRFSFVGRGDRAAYRDRGIDQTDDSIRQAIAAQLHAPERLARRFFTFERLLLPSLDAQQDGNFHLLVLTSDCLPTAWTERLKLLCATRPYLRLIRSAATDVNAGFLPEIARLETEAGQRLVQFRIDDDDCLATDYIARLRRGAVALQGYPEFAYSRPHGAVATLYPGQPTGFYELRQPFHAAGCACRLDRPGATIFSFGHFALRDRFPALLDNEPAGHLALKLPDQDSERLDTSAYARRGHREIARAQFAKLLAGRFPFVELDALAQLAETTQ